MIWKFAQFAAVAGLLLGSVGCGGGGPATGTVEGTVTHAGGSLAGAYVNFFDKQSGVGGAAPIGPEGKFKFEQPLRVGHYGVTIIPPSAPPPLPVAGAEVPAAKPPEIPQQYRSEATSGLEADVKEGTNTFDFTLP